MSDDKNKRGEQDRRRVNPNEDYEVRHEAEKLGVSTERVRAAIKKVGDSREAIEREIRGTKS
jgi:hypothetical protein